MGREVRMVPAEWQHPKDERGNYIPLFDANVAQRQAEWDTGAAKWAEGLIDDYRGGWEPKPAEIESETYADWSGERPDPADYMPQWDDAERTHLMMYETCTEGTPISPAFATPEELAHWLADTNAISFGYSEAPYEAWLRVCKGGYAPSAIMDAKVSALGWNCEPRLQFLQPGSNRCKECGGWVDHIHHSRELWSDVDRERDEAKATKPENGKADAPATQRRFRSCRNHGTPLSPVLWQGEQSDPVLVFSAISHQKGTNGQNTSTHRPRMAHGETSSQVPANSLEPSRTYVNAGILQASRNLCLAEGSASHFCQLRSYWRKQANDRIARNPQHPPRSQQ